MMMMIIIQCFFLFSIYLFSRLYCSVCRALSDLDQAQFLVCEILLQSTAINTLPLVVAMVSMWPKAFSRNAFGPPLLVNGVLNTKGIFSLLVLK